MTLREVNRGDVVLWSRTDKPTGEAVLNQYYGCVDGFARLSGDLSLFGPPVFVYSDLVKIHAIYPAPGFSQTTCDWWDQISKA